MTHAVTKLKVKTFRPFKTHRMHEMWTIVTNDPVAWTSVSVCMSDTRSAVITHYTHVATSMQPLLHYCSHFPNELTSAWHSVYLTSESNRHKHI